MLQSNRTGTSDPRAGTVVDAWTSLALWLRAGRSQRGLTLEDVARVTKIQTRTLERLESGQRTGLPADVFVRGFVRSFAKCVGLDDGEALRRYGACCGGAPATVVADEPSARTRAMLEAMSELAPASALAATPAPAPAVPTPAVAPAIELPLAAGSLADLPRTEPARRRVPTIEPAEGDTPRPIYVEREPIAVAVIAPEPVAAEPVAAEAAETAEAAAPSKRKRGRRGGKGRNKRKTLANGTPPEASPVVAASDDDAEIAAPIEVAAAVASEITLEAAPPAEPPPLVIEEPIVPSEPSVPSEPWRPTMPPAATQSAPPWGRPRHPTMTPARVVPSLVIDDADPERAEEVLEERAAAKSVLTTAQRRSLLPPILLDREDRSARQGGLTLAVILLLIAATITLSYLMRRPSSSGDGVTLRPSVPAATDVIS